MKDERPRRFRLSGARRQLLDELLARPEAPGRLTISRRVEAGPEPLSFAQQRLWFLAQLEPDNPVYNIPFVLQLSGPLQIQALEDSLNFLLERHPALRTVFPIQSAQPLQVVQAARAALIPEDVPGDTLTEKQAQARRLAVAEGRQGFDLAQGSLFRLRLLRLLPEEHWLLMTVHHAVFDEWSTGIFFWELAQVYPTFLLGAQPVLPSLPVEYGDFSAWQRRMVESGAWQSQLEYWVQHLRDAPEALDLPLDAPRPAVQSFRGASFSRLCPEPLAQAVRQLSQERQVTSSTVLLAAFASVLQRWTGQEDLTIGIPVANRQLPEVANVVGFFLNTLALRLKTSGPVSFAQVLHGAHQVVLEGLANQDIPFDQVVDACQPRRDLSRQPLFQVLFVYGQENLPPALGSVKVTPLYLDYGWSKFDLTLYLSERTDGLWLRLEYATDLFRSETAERLLDAYLALLADVVANPNLEIGRVGLLSPAERQLVLYDWNATDTVYPAATNLAALFEAQAQRTPETVALEWGERRWSYHELDQAAGRVADFLRRLGVGPDQLVGLYFERSPEQLVALLGVLKAGGAVVPLDPAYPALRRAQILELSRPQLVLSHTRLSRVEFPAQVPLACCDVNGVVTLEQAAGLLVADQAGMPAPARPDDLAYVLYTSGSTGVPKGVAMPHRTLVNLLAWQLERSAHFGPQRTLQFTSLNFDVSFQEIFATWAAGGALVLIDEDTRRDPARLLAFLREQQIQRLFLPFVALHSLAEAAAGAAAMPASLQEVITAGEQLRVGQALRNFFNRLPGCRLDNQYGPTEAHVVSAYRLEGDPQSWPALPAIGHPIANARLYVLNGQLEPAPIGVRGELYIGGLCLARGYYGQPDMTAERFLTSPFAPGERLYRTGDLARFLPDGNLEFLGRVDGQVKVRGYRVETGEIESVLSQHPGVNQVVVVAQREEGDSGVSRLVAYVVPRPGWAPHAGELRQFLQARLPEVMLPAALVFLNDLPLTPNGKIDRRRLPVPQRQDLAEQVEYSPPADNLETHLCHLWEQVLGVHPVGVNDSFFDLGGHSLLALQLFSLVEAQLGQRLPVTALFLHPTVAQLATLLRQLAGPADWPDLALIQPGQAGAGRIPFFMVHTFGGGVLSYAPVIQAMGADQPVYGLQARGLDGVSPPHTTIPEMAAYYVQAVRQVQPHGPYLLGGYCLGGVIAYEMACQLQALGEATALLAIIDGYAPTQTQPGSAWLHPGRWLNLLRNLPFWLRDFSRLERKAMWINIRRRLRLIRAGLEQGLESILEGWRSLVPPPAETPSSAAVTPQSPGSGDTPSAHSPLAADELIREHVAEAPEFHQKLMGLHMQALMDYQPPRYDGHVTLLRVRTMPLFRFYAYDAGWGQLARQGVTVTIIPGSHHNLLEAPHASSLGRELRRLIDQAHG